MFLHDFQIGEIRFTNLIEQFSITHCIAKCNSSKKSVDT